MKAEERVEGRGKREEAKRERERAREAKATDGPCRPSSSAVVLAVTLFLTHFLTSFFFLHSSEQQYCTAVLSSVDSHSPIEGIEAFLSLWPHQEGTGNGPIRGVKSHAFLPVI